MIEESNVVIPLFQRFDFPGDEVVDLDKEGDSWQTIADMEGLRIQNVARVLKQRGYAPDV